MNGKHALTGILISSDSPATGPQPPGSVWHGTVEAEAEKSMETWRRKRVSVANIRHARREAKRARPNQAKEEETTAVTGKGYPVHAMPMHYLD